MTTVAPNHFNRAKPFYPVVMNYMVQLIGFKELALRGVVGPATVDELLARLKRQPKHANEDVELIRKGVTDLMGPLSLRCEVQSERIVVEIDDVAREIQQEHGYLLPHMLSAAGSSIILAHEFSKDRPWHDQGPLWEFLRHCRHAAAHSGRFTFRNGEPRRSAAWGPLQITSALGGTPLFKSENGVGFLSLGDPVRLLWDIEQAYPAMSV